MRWSKYTSHIIQLMMKLGGARTIRMFRANVAAPHLRTLQRGFAKDRYDYKLGLDEVLMAFLSSLYASMMKKRNIVGPVPAELATDETAIVSQYSFSTAHHAVVGGLLTEAGSLTWDGCSHSLPTNAETYVKLIDYINKSRLAKYLALTCVCPLHVSLPPLPLLLRPTCNRFTFENVKDEWRELSQVFRKHFRGVLSLIGAASDGDGRRFKCQIGRMLGSGERFRCKAPCFTLTALIMNRALEEFDCIDSQDPFHCGKKLQAAMASMARVLMIGNHMATWNALMAVFDKYDASEHGLSREDVDRKDRMSVTTLIRACSPKVTKCLQELREKHGAETLGAQVWLEMVAKFLGVFYSSKWSAGDRVEAAATVINFLAIKYEWIRKSNLYDAKVLAESKQCFQHAILAMNSAILRLKLFAEFFPELPWCLITTGSDACEAAFSRLGGCGELMSCRRNFTVCDATELCSDLLTMKTYEFDSDAPVNLGKLHRSRACDFSSHEDSSAENANYSLHLTDAEELTRAAAGLRNAQALAIRVGIDESGTVWWNSPWEKISFNTTALRDADLEDQEREGPLDHWATTVDDLDATPPPDEIFAAKGVVAAILDQAHENEGPKKQSMKIEVPDRRRVHIQKLLAEINMNIGTTTLSNDRTARVCEVQLYEKPIDYSKPTIQVQGDIAVLYQDGWYLARVMRMFNDRGKSKQQWTKPVDFETMPRSFGCQCKLYRATDQARLLYTLNSPDPDPVKAEQIIAVVEMQFQGEDGLWKVSADTVEMLDGLHEAAS